MAIVALNKITLYGTIAQKAAVLNELQSLGCLHLVDLRPEVAKQKPAARVSAEAYEALRYLQASPVQRRAVKDPANFDFDQVYEEALEVQRRQRQREDERDQLLRAVEDLQPWGEFQLPERQELGDLQFWFYRFPHYQLKKLDTSPADDTDAEARSGNEDLPRTRAGFPASPVRPSERAELIWQVVARDQRFAYVVVLGPHEPQGLPVPRVQLDPRPLSKLHQRLEEVELELEDLHWQRGGLTRWSYLLAQTLAAAEDRDARQWAAEHSRDEAPLFALQGWTPRPAVAQLAHFSQQHGLAMTVEEPDREDNPPTLLDNPEPLAGGEEAVKFYMTPGYRLWDPSIVMFFSFSLFFAMIFADAGYGLLLGLLLLLMWRRMGGWEHGRRLRNLGLGMVAASVAYGLLVGTYFGLKPPPDSPLARLYLLDSQDQTTMIRLSIVIGVLHLGLANLITAWLYRRSFRALAPLGWTAMLLGGLTAGLGATGTGQPDWLVPAGVGLLGGGAIAVLLFSSGRPLPMRSVGDLFGRLLDGLKSLAGVSQAFGDVLSYLRLFALGLATTQLAVTFNQLAGEAVHYRGVGVLLATSIVILGHGLNLALATLSGVVHGLRLICIEFFNWSLPEEGYPFRAFAKKAAS